MATAAASAVHLGSTAEEEHHGSVFPLLTALSATLFLAGLVVPLLAVVAIVLLAVSLVGWSREVLRELEAPAVGQRTNGFCAMLVLLVAETALFIALFFFWFWARGYSPAWPPAGIPAIEIGLPAFNTLLLVSSGATVFLAERFLAKGNRRAFLGALALTVVLGAAFLVLQVQEYLRAGFTWQDGTYGSAFFILTGTHGAHVLVGLVVLTALLVLGATGRVTKERPAALPAAAIYWHFVDAVWLVLFAVVYLRVV